MRHSRHLPSNIMIPLDHFNHIILHDKYSLNKYIIVSGVKPDIVLNNK